MLAGILVLPRPNVLIPKKIISKFKKKGKKKPKKNAPFYAIRQMNPLRRIYRRKSF